MRRREFLGVVGGAAAFSFSARALERVRRIGVLMPVRANDAESPARIATFAQGLQQLGWTIGGHVQVDYRWSEGDADRIRKNAAELIALAPDVLLTARDSAAGPLLPPTRPPPRVPLGGARNLRPAPARRTYTGDARASMVGAGAEGRPTATGSARKRCNKRGAAQTDRKVG